MGYIDEFYKNLHFICYAAPVIVFADLGRKKLLQIADRCEVGREERKAQYIDIKSRELGFSLLNNIKGKRLHDLSRMSKAQIELEIKDRGENLPLLYEDQNGAKLVVTIARSQFGRAFHMLHSCYSEKDIYYQTLHTDEIHLLARVLRIENARFMKSRTLCAELLKYIQCIRNEKR